MILTLVLTLKFSLLNLLLLIPVSHKPTGILYQATKQTLHNIKLTAVTPYMIKIQIRFWRTETTNLFRIWSFLGLTELSDFGHLLLSAPDVILDVRNLPTHSAKTQCPECNQFVSTETFASVSSVTWLVCFMTAMIGYELSLPIGSLVKYLPKGIVALCCVSFCLLSHFQVLMPFLFIYYFFKVLFSLYFVAAWPVAA